MPSLLQSQRTKIEKLMSDPRYWDAHHPEHAQAFAGVQRAFQDAYPEEPSNDTTTGTVHVRAYTRRQDGQVVEVSEYDRTQKIALRGLPPEKHRDEAIGDVSNNPFHDSIVDDLVGGFKEGGSTVEKDIRFTSRTGEWSAEPDLFIRGPDGNLLAIEVKTGGRPKLNLRQRVIYKMLGDGFQVYTRDPRIERFGFRTGAIMPPMCVYSLYARGPGEFYGIAVLSGGPHCEATFVTIP